MDKFAAYEHLHSPIWIYDFDNKSINWANTTALQFWEATSLQELKQRNLKASMSMAVDASLAKCRKQIEQQECVRSWWRFSPKQVTKRALCQFSGITLDDNRLGMLVSVLAEENELKREIAFAGSGNLSLLFDQNGKHLSSSPAFCELCPGVVDSLKSLVEDDCLAQQLLTQAPKHEVQLQRSTMVDGNSRYFNITANWLSDKKQLLVNLVDITENNEQLSHAKFQASHDYLTGLLNRRGMIELLTQQMEHQAPFHLIFFDLDNFKSINDTYGHLVGDQLLKSVANRLKNGLKISSHIARFGGDEFVIIAHKTDYPSLKQLLVHIQTLMRPCHRVEHIGELMLTVSLGATSYPQQDDIEIETLLKQSSTAMHYAKEQGRNRYELFSCCLAKKLRRKVQIRQRISNAMSNDQFTLNYQPIWDVTSNTMYGAEALLRWRDSELGVVGPDEFIPVAEESGQIIELGQWVLHTAIAQLSQWKEHLSPEFVMSVNVSQMQLNSKFCRDLASLLKQYQVPAHHLAIELTESCMMQQYNKVKNWLGEIVDLGVKLYLDDFGTGYSSLSVLQELPLNIVKLDKSFVQNHHLHNNTIIQATLSMCHALNIKVIAEGIETSAQRHNLFQQGYRYMQGYLYSKPIPKTDFYIGYLQTENRSLQTKALFA